MPLEVEARPSETSVAPSAERSGEAPILIGLINNMPDSAVEGTEAQFCSLLAAAAGPRAVRLRFSYLPEVQRDAVTLETVKERYWPIERLLSTPLDALIVTGTEPHEPSLRDEPYWDRLVDVLNWAEAHTVSSVWSCLAAHVAVLHLDGVERQRLPEKCVGVFDEALTEHPLTAGVTAPLSIPHSRWNDLPFAALKDAGYTILAQSPETGAGVFVKHGKSLLVFVQGHPEYEERALLKEYQRDVRRFFAGGQTHYPTVPAGYFSADVLARLRGFEEKAMAHRSPELLAAFPFSAAAACLVNTWRAPGIRFYRNWLSYVAAERRAARGCDAVSSSR